MTTPNASSGSSDDTLSPDALSPDREASVNSQNEPKGLLDRLRTGVSGAAGKLLLAGSVVIASTNVTPDHQAEAAQPTEVGEEPDETLMAYLEAYYGDKTKGRVKFRAKYLEGTVLEDHRENIPGEMTFAIPVAKEFPADVDPKYAAWNKEGRVGGRHGTRYHIFRSARNKGRWAMVGTNKITESPNNPRGFVFSIMLHDDLDVAMNRAEVLVSSFKIAGS